MLYPFSFLCNYTYSYPLFSSDSNRIPYANLNFFLWKLLKNRPRRPSPIR